MIADQDRSGWFGASDTAMIMGNWETKTFKKWWMQKLGLDSSHFCSTAMNAGTYYEHAILEHIGAERMDHQILLPEYRLRVNLDGDGPGKIHEVKTYKMAVVTIPQSAALQLPEGELPAGQERLAWAITQGSLGVKEWKPKKEYIQQVRVQMFAKLQEEGSIPAAEIVAYGLGEAEYRNFFLDIDPGRIKRFPVSYDTEFINQYLRRLRYLAACLERGVFPESGKTVCGLPLSHGRAVTAPLTRGAKE